MPPCFLHPTCIPQSAHMLVLCVWMQSGKAFPGLACILQVLALCGHIRAFTPSDCCLDNLHTPTVLCRFATPMRTPRAASARGEDRLVAEAQNLARLQQGQTPLFGGDSGVHIEKGDFGDSLDPRAGQSVRATPSALAGMTPAGGQTGMRSIGGVPGTPSVAGTPLRTPGENLQRQLLLYWGRMHCSMCL